MGGNLHSERPFKPGGTNTYTSRKRVAAATNRAVEKARRRLRIVRAAREVIQDQEVSRSAALAILRTRYQDPDDPFTEELPSRATYYRLLARAEEAEELSIELFLDRPKPGRPPARIDQDIQTKILSLMKARTYSRWQRLYKRVCQDFGHRAPSKHVFQRFIESLDPAEISAAAHGGRAAVADSIPKLTISAESPHEYWALDELSIPVFVRAYDPRKKKIVSVKAMAGAVLDIFSRAAIGFDLFRPFDTGTPTGYASHHITGLFFSSALPELAPDWLSEYTSSLPSELRMDNHSTHKELREMLSENGVTTTRLRTQHPWGNGIVEVFVRTFKGLCEDIRGADHRFLPADRAKEDPRRTRTKAATRSSSREGKKVIIAVEDLLSYEELRWELLKRLRAYNDSEHESLDGRTPRDVFHSGLRTLKPPRQGWDAILFLPAATVTMRKHLVIRGRRFAPEVNGRRLRVGEKVVYRADPLLRGVWVEEHGSPHFLPRLEEFSKGVQVGEEARNQQRIARRYSDEAQEELETHLEEEVGPGAVERGKAKAEYAAKKGDGTESGESSSEEGTPETETTEDISEKEKPSSSRPKTSAEDTPEPVASRILPLGLSKFGNRVRRN